MEFLESDQFKREFKKLCKKYRTLPADLEVVKKVISADPVGKGMKHQNELKTDGAKNHIVKMRMMCRSVRGSQFRLVYFYNGQKVEVLFIEMYFKGDKEREDTARINELISDLKTQRKWIVK